jgi:hypothetical protein
MAAPFPRVLTDVEKAKILKCLRIGMSLMGSGESVGMHHKVFWPILDKDPEFRRQCMSALAEYEAWLCEAATKAVEKGQSPAGIIALKERRFPHKYSLKPEMRRERDVREFDEDASTEARATSAEALVEAIEKLVQSRESGE